MGRMMDVLGNRGFVDMGISRHMLVAEAWDGRRRRRHRREVMNLMEEALYSKRQTRNSETDVVLWRGKRDVYKPRFSTRDTWNHIVPRQLRLPGTMGSGLLMQPPSSPSAFG